MLTTPSRPVLNVYHGIGQSLKMSPGKRLQIGEGEFFYRLDDLHDAHLTTAKYRRLS